MGWRALLGQDSRAPIRPALGGAAVVVGGRRPGARTSLSISIGGPPPSADAPEPLPGHLGQHQRCRWRHADDDRPSPAGRRRRDRGDRRRRLGVLAQPVDDDGDRAARGQHRARHPLAGLHVRRRERAPGPERPSARGPAPQPDLRPRRPGRRPSPTTSAASGCGRVAMAPSPEPTISGTCGRRRASTRSGRPRSSPTPATPRYTWQVDPAGLRGRGPHGTGPTGDRRPIPPGGAGLEPVPLRCLSLGRRRRGRGIVHADSGTSGARRADRTRYTRRSGRSQGAPGAESCAPTIDDLRYESVSLDSPSSTDAVPEGSGS